MKEFEPLDLLVEIYEYMKVKGMNSDAPILDLEFELIKDINDKEEYLNRCDIYRSLD